MWSTGIIGRTENGLLYTVGLSLNTEHTAGLGLKVLLRQAQELLDKSNDLPLIRQLSGEASGILLARDLIWNAWHRESGAGEYTLLTTRPPGKPSPGSGAS